MEDYLKEFVQESDEQITDLNNALLDLESDPEDEDAMEQIFRTAHNIKGNCGAMGFTKAADLSHAIEDLLEEMRVGRISVTPDTMDQVFEAVDTLEAMIEEVSDHDEPRTDPSEVIQGLRATISDAPGPDVRIEEPSDKEIETALDGVEGPAEDGQFVYHVRLAVTEDESEDEGMLVLEALADAFDVLATNPPQNVIRAEDYGGSFDAVISSSIGVEDITAALEAVEQVDEVLVTDVSENVGAAEAAEEIDVEDMEVEELLESVSEFDDIERRAEEIAEEEAMEELGSAGTFDEVEVNEPDEEIEIEGLLEDEELADDDEIEESDLGDMSDLAEPEEPQNANDVFKELQDEVDQVDYEELEPELEQLEFDEYADDEEVGFDELVGDVEEDTDDLDAFGSEFDESEDGLDEVDELFDETDAEIEADPDAEEMDVDELIEAAGEETAAAAADLDIDVDDLSEGSDKSSGTEEEDPAAEEPPETGETPTAGSGSPVADAEETTASDDDLDFELDVEESPDEAEAGSESGEAEPDEAEPDDPEELAEIDTIRVDVQQVDTLLNQVEELVTSRFRLRRAIEDGDLGLAMDELDELETLTTRMQDTVMDVRLVPLEQVVGRLPRAVRDIARDQGKQVDFSVDGAEVELDRRILSELGDPLMHLVRNAVDHGIGTPEEREAAGKPPEGSLTIDARRSRDRVIIEISDDGRGLDTDAIVEQAIEEGLVTREEIDAMVPGEIHELIFEPGFTTVEEVTGVSGRGVGMDVVRETVQSLDGTVGVDSEDGEGTTIRLQVPVTVAIDRVLFVESGGEEFGVPVKNVDEIGRMTATETVDGETVLTYDEKVYPVVELGEALETPGPHANGNGMLLRISDDVRQIAVHCDRVTRQEEVVVKPFEGILSGIPGLSGAAVLGEGDVVNILDVETL